MTDQKSSNMNVSTIHPSQPFLKELARTLINEYSENTHQLSDVLILLPTRRTCRALQDNFLTLSPNKTLILPQMQPIGDIDVDELSLCLEENFNFSINEPIPAIKRDILLAKLIAAKRPEHTHGLDQDLILAKALGRLMDEIHTENLDFTSLANVVSEGEVAEHWQITLSFLEILSIHWPNILEEIDHIDAAAYRNHLIKTLNSLWQSNTPKRRIIMAGSTGSIPATAALAKTIASLPNGEVILPGLDKAMCNNTWNDVVEGHPQNTLKILLEKLNLSRNEVSYFVTENDYNAAREKLISDLMLPAEKTNQWGAEKNIDTVQSIEKDLKNIKRYDCETINEEASIIALILRETLEHESKTAALITTNRQLARRVSEKCKKWGVVLDDTAGKALTDTPLGQYLYASAQCCIKKLDSVALLSFLKHDFTSIENIENYRTLIRQLEIDILRGKPLSGGFEGLENRYNQRLNDPMGYNKPKPETLNFINNLKSSLGSYYEIFQKQTAPFSVYLENHITLAEKCFGHADKILWSGDAGEAATKLFSELNEYNDLFNEITPNEYLNIIKQFMDGITIRPKFGTNPRLQILGQIEGRLVQTDRVILAGLNEGSWPPDPGHDPWMSRPMRQKFGLPAPERSITLAAHDFSQAFCAREVFLTRSIKIDGTPTVPARWLERMDTYLTALDINPDQIKGSFFKSHLSHLDKTNRIEEITRPSPTPPLEARPTHLSVTYIDKWMKDPYGIYAQKILDLKKLLPLNDRTDAADKGIIFHEILHRFNKKYPNYLSNVTSNDFIKIAQDVWDENKNTSESLSFWKPRLIEFAENYLTFEAKWRSNYTPIYGEIKGTLDLNKTDAINFKISARVDRIDRGSLNDYAIIDYKSGGSFSTKHLLSGANAQLPLEGLILSEGNFENISSTNNDVSYLGYWVIDNTNQSIKETALKEATKVDQSMTDTKAGLISLIQTYQNPETAYLAIPDLNNAPRFNDYEHLERLKEWAALCDQESDSAYP